MDVRGTCKCGHDAKEHENIDARFVAKTTCGGETMGPTNFSGTIVRTMKCTCTNYSPEVVPVPVPVVPVSTLPKVPV